MTLSTDTPVVWRLHDNELRAFVRRPHPYNDEIAAVWAPQPGAQEAFLSCPVFECLLEGPRGGGKTEALLMDYVQHVSRGFGEEWRGILFRRTFPQLRDVIAKSKKLIPRIFPRATYNETKSSWKFPDREELLFAVIDRPEDYWNFHGHQYPWIAFEELTTWPSDACYKVMFSCSRSSKKKMPRKVRATTNPYGVGHNWVKNRFHLPIPPGSIVGPVIETPDEPQRLAIHSSLAENKVLLSAEPGYLQKIRAAARNESELRAWLDGSWDIVSGGMFDDLWNPEVHVLPYISPHLFPSSWRIDRAYDHGQSKPFSVGWYAQSSGEPLPLELPDGSTLQVGPVRGDLIRFEEWYGCTGVPDEGTRLLATEIADGILWRESEWGIASRVRPGVADAAIFDEFEPTRSVAGEMLKRGLRWWPSDKGTGSRAHGWIVMRERLKAALEAPRERPGLFVTENCEAFRRTVPVLPRSEKKLDDVEDKVEDHVADEVRYRCRMRSKEVETGSF